MKTLSKTGPKEPWKFTEDTVVKLESIFKIGGTDEEACSYALIHRATFYRWLKEDEDFATRISASKHYSDIAAKNVVIDTIIKDKNLESAKWWLEKRQFNQPLIAQQFNVNDMKLEIVQDAEETK